MIDITEIKFVKDLNMLRDLNLSRNPINELPDYRLLILFRIPKLKELDRRKIDVKEKVVNAVSLAKPNLARRAFVYSCDFFLQVSATNLFDPPMEVVAQRDHVMHTVYSFLQPKRVLER